MLLLSYAILWIACSSTDQLARRIVRWPFQTTTTVLKMSWLVSLVMLNVVPARGCYSLLAHYILEYFCCSFEVSKKLFSMLG